MKKHPTEFAINMNLQKMLVLQQPELKDVTSLNYFDEYSPCHLYFICKRPRISLNLDKFEVTEDYFNIAVNVYNKSGVTIEEIKFANEFGSTDVVIESDYPYNTFTLIVDKKILLDAKLGVFLQSIPRMYTNAYYLDLEILYIGQSYGVEGSKTAPDRLKSHSTLQGIYAEAMINNPDSEIWIGLASFEEILITLMDGRSKWTQQELDGDTERRSYVMNKIIDEGINEQQKINFTEAALIRYFQPSYNKIYKDSFPNPAHSTYSECYDLDINSVAIELQTYEMINCYFYSEAVERVHSHMHTFFLHSPNDRRDMFNYSKWIE